MSTTTSPAPVTPPPRLGATSHVEEPEQLEEPRRSVYGRWLGDVLSIALLVAMFWWLSYHDGGRAWTAMAQVGILAVVTLPFLAGEIGQLPRLGRILLLSWPLGLAASVVFAADRTGFSHPLVIFTVVPIVGLAAHRIWRREWGPVAMFSILVIGFGLYWHRSFMQWWGYAMWEGRALEWRPLSWHNQSGTLMAAFGLMFGGLALASRKVLTPVGILLSAGAFAGVWLSGSRGTLAATMVGLIALLVGAARRRGWWRAGASLAVVAVATAAVTFSLLSMAPQAVEGASRPDVAMTGRTQTAETSFLLRLNHWEAATGMFVDAPLTGQGLGSFRRMSLPFTPPDATLTAYPHNVYLRALGEGGLVLAVPLVALSLTGFVLATRRVLLPTEPPPGERDVTVDDIRWPLSLGVAGATAMLLAHQGVDFDWVYPVLPGLLALGLGIVVADEHPVRRRETTPSSITPLIAVVLTGALLTSGVVATFWENRSRADQGDLTEEEYAARPVAWDSGLASSVALDLSRAGRHDLALSVLDRTVAWNPRLADVRIDRAIVRHRLGQMTDRDLVELALDAPWDFASLNEVAQELVDSGEHGLAQAVLRSMLEVYPDYDQWGIDGNRGDTWYLLVRSAAMSGGCTAAQDVAGQAFSSGNVEAALDREPIEILVDDVCQ